MRTDWDARARENAEFYIASANADWNQESFFKSGEENVQNEILTDMFNVCQGLEPDRMRVLEIGCGAGRITRALASVFGEVHAVDISPEMVALATENLQPDVGKRVFLYANNGSDLQVLPSSAFDFAFSYIVFQHIPSLDVIESYIRDAHRVLKPGRLFKFQVQGTPISKTKKDDTWVGAPVTPAQAHRMAERCGFECRYEHGAGTQYYWLWFFKRD